MGQSLKQEKDREDKKKAKAQAEKASHNKRIDSSTKYKNWIETYGAKAKAAPGKEHKSGGTVHMFEIPGENFQLVWHDHEKAGKGSNRMEVEEKVGGVWVHRDSFTLGFQVPGEDDVFDTSPRQFVRSTM